MKVRQLSQIGQETGKTTNQDNCLQLDPLSGRRFHVQCSDALDLLSAIASNTIDSMVTDPPSGIKFMGQKWDTDFGERNAWIGVMQGIFQETYRTMKPGAYGIVWALPRTSHWTATALENVGFDIRDCITHLFATGLPKGLVVKSEDLPEFAGWGTTLKPASEHWLLVQKPMKLSVLANLRRYGTGALNLPACAIPVENGQKPRHAGNLIHDGSDEVRSCFPDAKGQLAPLRGDGAAMNNRVYGAMKHGKEAHPPRIDSDPNAARLFYSTKASRSDRNAGLDEDEHNIHPTVKSKRLMDWLCRLVTPAGGIVLDPFTGSGSTGVASLLAGFRFIGSEREEAYYAIARKRIEHAFRFSEEQL